MIATLNESDDAERPVPEIAAVLVEGFAPVYGLEAVSTTCTLADAAAARVPMFQVTVPLEFVPPPVAETNVQPAGMTSEIVTPVADDVPGFEYVRV